MAALPKILAQMSATALRSPNSYSLPRLPHAAATAASLTALLHAAGEGSVSGSSCDLGRQILHQRRSATDPLLLTKLRLCPHEHRAAGCGSSRVRRGRWAVTARATAGRSAGRRACSPGFALGSLVCIRHLAAPKERAQIREPAHGGARGGILLRILLLVLVVAILLLVPILAILLLLHFSALQAVRSSGCRLVLRVQWLAKTQGRSMQGFQESFVQAA